MDRSTATVGQVIERIPTGRFHRRLLLVTGAVWGSTAFAVLVISFTLPTFIETWNLSGFAAGVLGSGTLLGMVGGGAVGGWYADRAGRRRTLALSVAAFAVLTGATALAQGFYAALVLRVLTGLAVGSTVSVDVSYLTEYLPSATRGRYIAYLEAFYAAGNVVTVLLAWAVLRALPAGGTVLGLAPWRVLFALGALPALGALLVFRLPASPYFVARHGDGERAADRLAAVARATGADEGVVPDRVRVEATDDPGIETGTGTGIGTPDESEGVKRTGDGVRTGEAARATEADEAARAERTERTPRSSRPSTANGGWAGSFRRLLDSDLAGTTALLSAVWLGLNFGYYGFVIWLPRTVEAAGYVGGLYAYLLVVSVCQLLGVLTASQVVDRLGRKLTLGGSFTLAGVGVLVVAAGMGNGTGAGAARPVPFLLGLFATGFFVFGAFGVVFTYSVEQFPTEARSTGMGVITGVGKLAAVAGPVVVGTFAAAGYVVALVPVALSLLGAGALLWLFGAETEGRTLA